MPDTSQVCSWCRGDKLLYDYHCGEWGIPLHDDVRHFEYLALEAMQCGLSWLLVLKKRDAIRKAFSGFDVRRVAGYTEADIQTALEVPGMIRSAGKIRAVVNNAGVFCKMQEEYGSFDSWLWSYTDGKTLVYKSHRSGLPASNSLSDEISAFLRKRGMKYLGSVTVYSYLQSAGIINDHEPCCRLYEYINSSFPVRFAD